MKKNLFFSEDFIAECERQLIILRCSINTAQPFGHPAELSPDEILLAKKFYNKVLYLLYQAGKIPFEEYIEDSYLF